MGRAILQSYPPGRARHRPPTLRRNTGRRKNPGGTFVPPGFIFYFCGCFSKKIFSPPMRAALSRTSGRPRCCDAADHAAAADAQREAAAAVSVVHRVKAHILQHRHAAGFQVGGDAHGAVLRHADGVALACEPLLMEFARPLGVIAENKRAPLSSISTAIGPSICDADCTSAQPSSQTSLREKSEKNVGLLFADALLQQLLVIHGTVSFSVFSYLIIPPSKMQTERSQNL